MKYCIYCGEELVDSACFCHKCGNKTEHKEENKIQNDNEPTFPYSLIGFFVPLAGLVLFIIWNDTYKRRAYAAGKAALISVIIEVALSILITIFVVIYYVGNGLM